MAALDSDGQIVVVGQVVENHRGDLGQVMAVTGDTVQVRYPDGCYGTVGAARLRVRPDVPMVLVAPRRLRRAS